MMLAQSPGKRSIECLPCVDQFTSVIEGVDPLLWRCDIWGQWVLGAGFKLVDELLIVRLVKFEDERVLVAHDLAGILPCEKLVQRGRAEAL